MENSKVVTLKLDQKFWLFYEAVRKQHPLSNKVEEVRHLPILSLDPGETTGTCEFDGEDTIRVYQKVTKDIGQSYDWLYQKLSSGWSDAQGFSVPWRPRRLRYEDYRVYSWKAEDHAWSPVHTIRWIGAIQVAAHITQTPSSCIMATHAKGFWTDTKLDMFGLNPKGLKHGRDALRHLLYYLCFPNSGQHAVLP